jgi:hypothetical protein
MKNKPKDKKYCGVDVEKITNPPGKIVFDEEVLRFYHLYLSERQKIYNKKELERLSPPWTSDPILSSFRFTNTRRELDKETVWLIENIVKNEKFSLEEKILILKNI